ncbi:F-box/kelch-repeat protein At3g23880-like, partial [Capsicum annuum]
MYGFGYDEFYDDYKLLGTFCRKSKFDRGELKIYSLKSDSWGSVDDCRLRKCKSREEVYISGIIVKGKLHWPNAKVNGLISDYKEWNIISFDLANEKWGEVEHPCYKEGYIHLYLGVLGSDLSIFCDNATSHVDFWVMKEYGVKQSWTKMLTVNYPFDTPWCDFYLPCFMSNKGEIFF